MRRFYALALALVLALAPASSLADPGGVQWQCSETGAPGSVFTFQTTITGNQVCVITSATDSTILVATQGPWQFCIDPDDRNDIGTGGSVQLWKTDGTSDVSNEGHAVLGLTLTGDDAAGLRCLYFLGAGRYWMEFVSGSPFAVVTFRHM